VIVTILFGIIGLGLMVFVHELGHFAAAKSCGIAVEVFSLGWGPRLVGFTRGGTSYQISWFPLGGYCKLKGEEYYKQGKEGDEARSSDSFFAASPLRRILVAASGPIASLVLALFILTGVHWAGFTIRSPDSRIVLATDYALDSFPTTPPATAAGLKTGDRVLAIDGTSVEKFQDLLEKVSSAAGKTMIFSVSRAGTVLDLSVTARLDKESGAGKIGVYAWIDPVVETVAQGTAASLAGILPADRIVKIGGKGVGNSMDLNQALQSRPPKLDVELERGGRKVETTLVLAYNEAGEPNIGLSFKQPSWRSPRLGPFGAAWKSVQDAGTTIVQTVQGFGLLFSGINLRNAVAGPLRITYYIGSAASNGFQFGIGQGLTAFLRLLSFLSIVLFLMNLLPIPALDGGQILLFLIEIVRKKPVQTEVIGRIQFAGFSVLILLSLAVTASDVLYFIGR